MRLLLILIFGWIWNILKVLFVGFILSLIWPDIELETVVALMTLYAVIMMIRKAIKK